MDLAIEALPVRSPSPLGATPTTTSTLDKLPPISPLAPSGGGTSSSSGGEEGERICTVLMQNTCTELKASMGHILNEVSSCTQLSDIHLSSYTSIICIVFATLGADCRDQDTKSH